MSGLPEGMANGPSQSEHFEDAQVWERPWTLEEMRQNSANWSLAADSGLVLFLQDFSQRMLSKTHEIEKQLDSLIRDTKATDSCLHSVFNDFLMLSNTQFIENRVYDEEVEDTIPKPDVLEKQPEQEKTREQKEAELIPKMQEAVNYGLKVLELAFEHLDMKAGNSDSEDEEANDRVEAILEPKDLYVDRPLPYLIGSQAFMEQDDVGLGDLSSDEMSVDSDRDSVIESEDGKDADHSDDFNAEEDESHNNIKKKSSMLSYDDDDDEEEEEDEDSDIFGDSDKDDHEDDAKSTGPSSFADELAARIKGEPVNKPEGDRASLASKKKSKGRKETKASKSQAADDDSDDMFKPPKMDYNDDDDEDDEFSPFGAKSGLFSGGRGLFDDDDEGDLFSEAPKPVETKRINQSTISQAQTAESAKPGKKIPAGGVSIFPENSLFNSGNDTESVRSKENGTPAPKSSPPSKPVPSAVGIGGGLFDDEDDDFFGSKSIQRSDAAGKEKPTSKTSLDLFAEEDEDGDIFGVAAPAPSKKEAVVEQAKSEKKLPAGAISMFGPGTKSLLSEGLKKRQQSTSEESEKSEENGPAPDVGKAAFKPSPIPKTRGLFSDDDEDTPVFPSIPRSQSKPESTNHSKSSKASLSFFDDEEEEDLFASAAKSQTKPNPAKVSPAQPSSTVSSSLFSDDEDQWLSYKSSVSKPESKTGGMKPSTSAPSSLPSSLPSSVPSSKTSQKSSLFDNDDDDDDLFGSTKETSQKKSPRVALLFEDEDEASLFVTKTSVNTDPAVPAAAKNSVVASPSPSQKSEEVTVGQTATEDKPPQAEMPATKTPEPLPSSTSSASAATAASSPTSSAAAAAAATAATNPNPEKSPAKKKPAGAVSLFGGINILGNRQTKNLLDGDDSDDDFLSKASPPPVQEEKTKEDKVKTKTVSLFEDGDVDEPDWNAPIFTPSKPTGRNTPESSEERPQVKSTGVFLDEELLFSHTEQKDNDPDVDLFATSGKESSKLGSVKPAAQSLFADDDEDDLFSSTKPKAPPPKIADKPSKPADKAPLASPESVSEIQKPAPSPVNPKDSSSRIGKLQANLKINPAALLPGAGPVKPGAISILPGMGPSSSSGVSSASLSPSPVTTPLGAQAQALEGGVSFDVPVQVATLQSAHKGRAKGAVQRRPQSRSARQQSAQRSVGDEGETLSGAGPNPNPSSLVLPIPNQSGQNQTSPTPPNSSAATAALSPSSSSPLSLPEVSPRPSELTLPTSADTGKTDSSKKSFGAKVLPLPSDDDLFGSDGLFEPPPVSNTTSTRPATKASQPQAISTGGQKKDEDKSTFSSIFDDNTDDLFKKVKPRSTTKKAKPSAFLEDDDDDEDIFGMSNSSTPSSTSSKEIKNSSSFSKQDIFQDEVAAVPKVQKKHKEKTLDSLFDDDIDIFADLTDTLTPKQKSKTMGETKSIFDDDMDEIFSSSTVKPLTKASNQSKKTAPSQESNAAAAAADSSNLFDDPLNALGGD